MLTDKRLSDKAAGAGDSGLLEKTFGALSVGVARHYSGHSLRAELATAAAEAEAQLHDVMRQTRHKSVEVARRYMHSADLWKNNVTARVMRRSG
ncbi:tyrosine-type recombinase/integrase [Azospirillum canadense]|uniref:tyrosine-type recombinase/integrase n=1 Tax=Azospirillum canadense TaxID=403962 RepID=UPI0022267BF0|nr:tyrosine-type recombinase/integrase [Azospirillum canadense]MCW2239680.1 integrase [Azospirillum canadense]